MIPSDVEQMMKDIRPTLQEIVREYDAMLEALSHIAFRAEHLQEASETAYNALVSVGVIE